MPQTSPTPALLVALGLALGAGGLGGWGETALGAQAPSLLASASSPAHFTPTLRHHPRPQPSHLPPPKRWVVDGEFPNTQFACQMAPAGDVNADGFADVLIAEAGFDGGRGRVLAY